MEGTAPRRISLDKLLSHLRREYKRSTWESMGPGTGSYYIGNIAGGPVIGGKNVGVENYRAVLELDVRYLEGGSAKVSACVVLSPDVVYVDEKGKPVEWGTVEEKVRNTIYEVLREKLEFLNFISPQVKLEITISRGD